MVDWILIVLEESIWGSLSIIKSLVIVVFPVMIVLQIMTDYKWMEKLSEKTKWVTDFLGVSKDTLIPLLIGVFAGVSYGAGAIIFAQEKYSLSKNDIFLAMCFLIPLHSAIESTFIFWVIGVNPALSLTSRFIIALSGTLIMKWYLSRKRRL